MSLAKKLDLENKINKKLKNYEYYKSEQKKAKSTQKRLSPILESEPKFMKSVDSVFRDVDSVEKSAGKRTRKRRRKNK